MSTRALYTFADGGEAYHVYKHSDGYPQGALFFLARACDYAFELPRYEPDEFAAAFVAANKIDALSHVYAQMLARERGLEAGTIPIPAGLSKYDRMRFPVTASVHYLRYNAQGGIRLLPSGKWDEVAPGDIAYRYVVNRAGQNLKVSCYHEDGCKKLLFWTLLDQWRGLDWQAVKTKIDEEHLIEPEGAEG